MDLPRIKNAKIRCVSCKSKMLRISHNLEDWASLRFLYGKNKTGRIQSRIQYFVYQEETTPGMTSWRQFTYY